MQFVPTLFSSSSSVSLPWWVWLLVVVGLLLVLILVLSVIGYLLYRLQKQKNVLRNEVSHWQRFYRLHRRGLVMLLWSESSVSV